MSHETAGGAEYYESHHEQLASLLDAVDEPGDHRRPDLLLHARFGDGDIMGTDTIPSFRPAGWYGDLLQDIRPS